MKYPVKDSTAPVTKSPSHQLRELESMRAYLALVMDARWWIVAVAAIICCAGVARAVLKKDSFFQSEVELQIEDHRKSDSLAQLSPVFVDRSQAGIEIATLRSAQFLAAAMKHANLDLKVEDLQRNLAIREKTPGTGLLLIELRGVQAESLVAVLKAILKEYLHSHAEKRSEEVSRAQETMERQLRVAKQERDAAEEVYQEERAKAIRADSLRGSIARGGRGSIPQVSREELKLLADGKGTTDPELLLSPWMIKAQQSWQPLKYWSDRLRSLQNRSLDLKNAQIDVFGNPRVIREPKPPSQTPGRSLPRTIVLWLVLSLGLGVVAVFVRELMQPTVKTSYEIEKALAVPVLAAVRRSRGKRPQREPNELAPLSVLDPGDEAVESLRGLRTALLFALREARNRIVTIAGPAPRAGASFVAVNVACLTAEAGKRVLLIDGDLRQGELHRCFNQAPVPGLVDVINGTTDLDLALRSEVRGRLDLLPAGNRIYNPSELLAGPQLVALVERIAAGYDIVIIDCPPILSFADAAILGGHAGTNLLLLRARKSAAAELVLAAKNLTLSGVVLGGAILNDVH